MDNELNEFLKNIVAKKLDEFQKNKDINTNTYRCWECEKKLDDLKFTDELKQECPRNVDGDYLVICKDCHSNQ